MITKLGVARGAISLGSARLVVNLLNTAGILFLARILTPADFGIVAIATAVLSVVASITEVSLQPALVQCKDPTREHVDTVWTMSLIRAILIFVTLAAAAWPLSIIYDDPRLLPVLLVTGITGALFDFYNPMITLSTRYMRFGPLTSFQICQKLIGLVIAGALALYLRNFWAIIIGNAIGAALACGWSYRLVPYRPKFTLSRFAEIWGFSRWLFLCQICETLNWRFDQLAVGIVAPKSALGHYAMADNLAVLPSREITHPMRSAIFAGMVNVNQHPEALRRSFLRSQCLMAMVSAPMALGLALVAEPAVLVLLDDQWLDCVIYVRIFALAYLLESFSSAVRPLTMASGDTKLLFVRQFVVLLFRIPLIAAGLIVAGLVGAAAGGLAAAALEFVVGSLIVGRILKLPFLEMNRTHLPTVFGLAVMTMAVLAADTHVQALFPSFPLPKLVLMIFIGAITYIGSIVGLWFATGKKSGPVSELISIAAGLISLLTARKEAR